MGGGQRPKPNRNPRKGLSAAKEKNNWGKCSGSSWETDGKNAKSRKFLNAEMGIFFPLGNILGPDWRINVKVALHEAAQYAFSKAANKYNCVVLLVSRFSLPFYASCQEGVPCFVDMLVPAISNPKICARKGAGLKVTSGTRTYTGTEKVIGAKSVGLNTNSSNDTLRFQMWFDLMTAFLQVARRKGAKSF